MTEMVIAFHGMPQVLSFNAKAELVKEELNGRPINRISGDLAESFDNVQIGPDAWAVEQTNDQAPYAERVMVYVSRARIQKTVMEALKERMFPFYGKAIVGEFQNMVDTIDQGRPYRWNPKTFENRI